MRGSLSEEEGLCGAGTQASEKGCLLAAAGVSEEDVMRDIPQLLENRRPNLMDVMGRTCQVKLTGTEALTGVPAPALGSFSSAPVDRAPHRDVWQGRCRLQGPTSAPQSGVYRGRFGTERQDLMASTEMHRMG